MLSVMKKISLIVMLFMTLSLPTFVACDSSDDKNLTEENGGGNGDGGGASADSQKQKLESVADELMGKVSADNFRNITDLFDYVETMSNDETAVEDWFEACQEACLISGGRSADKRYLYSASNFYGQFELIGGVWVKKGSARNLQFKFRDSSNRECVLLLTHSGKDTKVHHDEFDEENWYYNYSYGSYVERTENAFVIPENINVTLTQGGNQLVSAEVRTKLSISDASGEVRLDRDRAEVTSAVRVNDYSFIVDNAAVNAGSSASLTARFMKGSEVLLSAKVQGDGYTNSDEEVTVKKATMTAEVLGNRLRIAGTVSDMSRFSDYLKEADNNEYDGDNFKRAIDRANSLLDVKVYFDGNGTPSSTITLYPLVEDSYYYGYGEKWTYEPVFNFSDGTGYSTFGDYFDDDVFEDIIDRFERLMDDFADLVN